MTRRRRPPVGLCPQPPPRWRRLRRLHRADHLPAVPEDGRRAGDHRASRRDASGRTCGGRAASRSLRATRTRCARSASSRGILGDIFAGQPEPAEQPGDARAADQVDRRDRVDQPERRRQGRCVRGTTGEGGRRGQEGRRPILHPAAADRLHGPLDPARSTGQQGLHDRRSRLRHRGVPRRRLRLAQAADRRRVRARGRQADQDQDLLRPGPRRASPPPGAR